MSTTFDPIILRSELSQSATFGSFYKELLHTEDSPAFSSPLVEDVSELLNNLLLKYYTLTEFQKEMLHRIFSEFNTIRTTIDPKRLKSFSHALNNDEELLLYRETEKGLINLIINPDDCIAFSFIPNHGDSRKFYFVHPEEDFEGLAYDFFSY
jgi:hypothetical protein